MRNARSSRAALAAVSGGIACLGTAGAAFAGAVYVPVPDPISSTGSTHAIQIWITNGGTDQRPYTATFLNAESDGTQRPSTPPTPTPVAAGRTSVLGGVSAPGKSGLLEINASTAMSIDARLFSTSADALSSSVSPVPLISSDNLFDAGKTAVVLGLRRDLAQGEITSLGVVNLGKQAAQCMIKLVRADGSQIGWPGDVDLQAALAALLRRRLQPARRAAGGRRARGGELQPAVLRLRDAVQPEPTRRCSSSPPPPRAPRR